MLSRVLAKHGVTGVVPMPDLSTKAKAQACIGMNHDQLKADKEHFKKTVIPVWDAQAKEKGLMK